MRPLIGIPPALDDGGRWRAGRTYHYIDAAYAACIESCGGAAVYLPLPETSDYPLDRIDGLLIPGGGDFAPPQPYPSGVRFDRVPDAQRAGDERLLAGALECELPVLAICYGMQLLTLHCGGTLIYDLETERPELADHRIADPRARHALAVEAGSALWRAIGSQPEGVNSRHHQAVASAGPRLAVSARAGDGLIEAVELPGAAFCIGVQWHPESLGGAHAKGLFGSFVRACGERRGR
jgi:putative glutamine amidotransferase